MLSANDIWMAVVIIAAIAIIFCTVIAIASVRVGAEHDKREKQHAHNLHSIHRQERSTERRRG